MEKKQRKRTVKPLRKIGRSYPDEVKRKVVGEIQSGFHSHRTAAKLYGMSRNTVNSWVVQYSLLNLESLNSQEEFMTKSTESSTIRHLHRQVIELQKALVKSQLKVDSLETMIKVSEEELKIKIRKKPGAKQSRE